MDPLGREGLSLTMWQQCWQKDCSQHAESQTKGHCNGRNQSATFERYRSARYSKCARPEEPTAKRDLNADAQQDRQHDRKCLATRLVQ